MGRLEGFVGFFYPNRLRNPRTPRLEKPSENLHNLFTFQGCFDRCSRKVEKWRAPGWGVVDPSHRDQLFRNLEKNIITSSYRMTLDQQNILFFGSFRDWGILFFCVVCFFNLKLSTWYSCEVWIQWCMFQKPNLRNIRDQKKFDAIFTPRVAGKSSQLSKFLWHSN